MSEQRGQFAQGVDNHYGLTCQVHQGADTGIEHPRRDLKSRGIGYCMVHNIEKLAKTDLGQRKAR